MTLRRFAKNLNYKNARDKEFNAILRQFIQRGWIEIQQSGYLAHSNAHPKLVVIREPLHIDRYKRILEKLKVNFQIGEYTVHRTTKPRKCGRCKDQIYEGERYGVKPLLRRYGGVRNLTVLCFPCLINDYEEFYDFPSLPKKQRLRKRKKRLKPNFKLELALR